MKPPKNNGPRSGRRGDVHRPSGHPKGPRPGSGPAGEASRSDRPAAQAAGAAAYRERLGLPRGGAHGDAAAPASRPAAPRPAHDRSDDTGRRKDWTPAQRPHRTHEPHPRPSGPDAPRGTVWLYGQHAVASALANPARRLRRLMLTEEAETALAARLRQPWPIPHERVDRGRLDQLLGRETAHQGVALLADPLAPPSLAQALERPGPVLVLDQVSDPRNVGAILRAAAAFGASAVITQDRNAPEETGALAKAASGALEKVPLFRAVNIARTLVALKAAGCWVVGLDAGGTTLTGGALRERRVALVLGSEGEGLRRLTRDTCDEIAGLALPKGHGSEMESLNVAAAAAIALYEVSRPA